MTGKERWGTWRKKIGLVLGMVSLLSLTQVEVKAQEFSVVKEGKGVTLEVSGQRFEVRADSKGSSYNWLDIDDVAGIPGIEKSFSLNFVYPEYKGWVSNFAARYIQEIKVVLDKEEEKVVYVKAKAYNHPAKKIVEPYYMEMNLRIKKGFPCLFIHQRVTNPSDSPKSLSFGSYARNCSTYAGVDLKVEKMPKKGALGKRNFFWAKREITEKTEGSKGFGIISFIPTSFFSGCLNVYFGYVAGVVEEGEYLESRWAVMAAETPEEAKALYEKIKDIKFGDFLLFVVRY